eukprot:TRINITY_DN66415_c3_g14_i1.p1 TRINITY_DN66415_c3_g14~~TRINITY_DN66415_c3_g14_i1.p1  ORF type:complete len:794 (-),score=440.69 TRINITY_DN66415_c3_g14_i1:99-2456(-)
MSCKHPIVVLVATTTLLACVLLATPPAASGASASARSEVGVLAAKQDASWCAAQFSKAKVGRLVDNVRDCSSQAMTLGFTAAVCGKLSACHQIHVKADWMYVRCSSFLGPIERMLTYTFLQSAAQFCGTKIGDVSRSARAVASAGGVGGAVVRAGAAAGAAGGRGIALSDSSSSSSSSAAAAADVSPVNSDGTLTIDSVRRYLKQVNDSVTTVHQLAITVTPVERPLYRAEVGVVGEMDTSSSSVAISGAVNAQVQVGPKWLHLYVAAQFSGSMSSSSFNNAKDMLKGFVFWSTREVREDIDKAIRNILADLDKFSGERVAEAAVMKVKQHLTASMTEFKSETRTVVSSWKKKFAGELNKLGVVSSDPCHATNKAALQKLSSDKDTSADHVFTHVQGLAAHSSQFVKKWYPLMFDDTAEVHESLLQRVRDKVRKSVDEGMQKVHTEWTNLKADVQDLTLCKAGADLMKVKQRLHSFTSSVERTASMDFDKIVKSHALRDELIRGIDERLDREEQKWAAEAAKLRLSTIDVALSTTVKVGGIADLGSLFGKHNKMAEKFGPAFDIGVFAGASWGCDIHPYDMTKKTVCKGGWSVGGYGKGSLGSSGVELSLTAAYMKSQWSGLVQLQLPMTPKMETFAKNVKSAVDILLKAMHPGDATSVAKLKQQVVKPNDESLTDKAVDYVLKQMKSRIFKVVPKLRAAMDPSASASTLSALGITREKFVTMSVQFNFAFKPAFKFQFGVVGAGYGFTSEFSEDIGIGFDGSYSRNVQVTLYDRGNQPSIPGVI